jgi:hypothetical protein
MWFQLAGIRDATPEFPADSPASVNSRATSHPKRYDERVDAEERAAIMEFDGGLIRDRALVPDNTLNISLGRPAPRTPTCP